MSRDDDIEQLRKLVRAIIKEGGAPGPEHERIRKALAGWALARGFVVELKGDLDGKHPDVFRGDQNGEFVFVGEAKDAENETADNAESLKRFLGYVFSFCDRIREESVAGGLVAMATNDSAEAELWSHVIAAAARVKQVHRADGKGPIVTKVDDRTWIAWW